MKEEKSEQATIHIKAYSTKELAKIYEVSEKIFRAWLAPFKNEIGKKAGWFYTPKQAKIIFDKVGIPEITHLN